MRFLFGPSRTRPWTEWLSPAADSSTALTFSESSLRRIVLEVVLSGLVVFWGRNFVKPANLRVSAEARCGVTANTHRARDRHGRLQTHDRNPRESPPFPGK